MKKIELTEQQKNKLLEMCNDLFPEYDEVTFESILDISENHVLTGNLFFYKASGDNVTIHWFELCVVEIPERIAHSTNTVYPEDKQAFIVDMMMKKLLNYSFLEETHPVDYLYEMYQKTLEK